MTTTDPGTTRDRARGRIGTAALAIAGTRYGPSGTVRADGRERAAGPRPFQEDRYSGETSARRSP
ncbi:hypothetical protein [Actinomadura verrucosospora]|uniref:Uncharacterized protein n=1 Tax=Actinomadura verrucosospora TaxID=46165 RepID=A0A7D3VNR9_ACTVE|nr:hypothetical protein [Actinomadura verrucosospora]QKG18479.1 hypothetical protein ACTIVE_0113 [Actinomadura verrucosospora]